MKKIKDYIMKNKIKTTIIASILAFIVALILFIFSGKIDIIEEIKPVYSGYNKLGTLTYNEDDVKKNLRKEILKKYGVSDSDISKIVMTNSDYADQLIASGSETGEKIIKANADYENVEIDFDKTENLSNGEKVTLTIKVPKDSPVKSGEKIFEVSGLKKGKSISAESYIEKNPLTFEGYNGYGSISDNGVYTIESKNLTNLSNGDVVKFKINNSLIESSKDKGVVITDAGKVFEQEVEGLKEISSITNIKDVLPKIEEQVKADNKNDTDDKYRHIIYNLEKQNTFIKYSEGSGDNPKLSVVSVYKITKTTTNTEEKIIEPGKIETKTYYYAYGYDNLDILDGKLILKDLSSKKHSVGLGWKGEFEDLDSQVAELKSDDYIEYKE